MSEMERLTHYYNGKVAEPYNRTEALNMARKLAEFLTPEEAEKALEGVNKKNAVRITPHKRVQLNGIAYLTNK